QGLARLQSAEFLYETQLFPDVEYTFKHALTHEVAYASLLHERRRALHARVVDAIERLYPDGLAEHRDRLVHHAFRGEVWSKALAYLRDLGQAASTAEIEQIMGVGPENPGQLWWSGEHERAIKAAERDVAVGASFGNVSLRVAGICRLGQTHHALGDYTRAIDLFKQIMASVHGDLVRERFGMAAFPAVFARSWLCWCLAERGEFAEGAAAGAEAAQLAESADDAYSRAHIAFGLGTLHVLEGRPDRAIPVLERGLVVARLAGIPLLVPFITAPLGAAYTLEGRLDRAVPALEQAIEQAVSMRLVANHALRLAWLGHAQLSAGRHEAAIDLARRALQMAEEHRERGQQAYVHRLLGDAAAHGEKPDVLAAEAAYG
ncbi:MAG: hypothetical protein ACREU4_10965, partial [Burkholderiales bacterium]